MSYKIRRNEAKIRQLALLYTTLTLALLLSAFYFSEELATYWEALGALIRPLLASPLADRAVAALL